MGSGQSEPLEVDGGPRIKPTRASYCFGVGGKMVRGPRTRPGCKNKSRHWQESGYGQGEARQEVRGREGPISPPCLIRLGQIQRRLQRFWPPPNIPRYRPGHLGTVLGTDSGGGRRALGQCNHCTGREAGVRGVHLATPRRRNAYVHLRRDCTDRRRFGDTRRPKAR